MATLISFHAHPDDEAIACGGTIARAAAEGHRVVVIFATKGEYGEVSPGFLSPGEELWERREKEVATAADILGVRRVEYLGYVDSGMMGTPENDAPGSFWQADVDEAAERLAAILVEEEPTAFTIYDESGGYGHPDHMQVHRVGVRAAELAGTANVFEAVIDRDRALEMLRGARESGLADRFSEMDMPDESELETIGVPAEVVTHDVDVKGFLSQKRAAMAAHASQISETSFFLALPSEVSDLVWGIESYVLRGAPSGTKGDWIL
jgi:LmbE family N-acetylglucosaminyl deacetylase